MAEDSETLLVDYYLVLAVIDVKLNAPDQVESEHTSRWALG